MPTFKLHRNYTLRSLYGHVINFVKDEETYVPPMLVNECVAIGAVCVDGEADVLGEEEASEAVLTPDQRYAKICEAFDDIVKRNDPDDFTGQNIPKVAVVETATGLKIDKKEIVDSWQRFRAAEE